MNSSCSYWSETQLAANGIVGTEWCTQVLELCSLQLTGVDYSWGVWFMVVFYESFSTIYMLIAEVREDKREEASDDVLLENGDQKTSAVYEQTFVTKNFFLLICIFVSGALVWYSYELVHYVLLTSDYICYLVEPLIVERYVYCFNIMMLFFVVNMHRMETFIAAHGTWLHQRHVSFDAHSMAQLKTTWAPAGRPNVLTSQGPGTLPDPHTSAQSLTEHLLPAGSDTGSISMLVAAD